MLFSGAFNKSGRPLSQSPPSYRTLRAPFIIPFCLFFCLVSWFPAAWLLLRRWKLTFAAECRCLQWEILFTILTPLPHSKQEANFHPRDVKAISDALWVANNLFSDCLLGVCCIFSCNASFIFNRTQMLLHDDMTVGKVAL